MRYFNARFETDAVGRTTGPRSVEVRVHLNDRDPAYPLAPTFYVNAAERQRYCVVRRAAVAVAHREFSIAVTIRPRHR